MYKWETTCKVQKEYQLKTLDMAQWPELGPKQSDLKLNHRPAKLLYLAATIMKCNPVNDFSYRG